MYFKTEGVTFKNKWWRVCPSPSYKTETELIGMEGVRVILVDMIDTPSVSKYKQNLFFRFIHLMMYI